MNIVIVTQKPIQTLNLIYLLGGAGVFPGAIIAIKPGHVSADYGLVDEYTESINALKLQCDILSIPLHTVENLTSNKVIDLLTSLKIDLILSLIAEILNEEFIKTSRYGVVSSHGGILPSYRGVDCIKWAILNDDNNQVGVTTQLIDQGVDTGEIIDTHTIDLTSARPCKVSDLSREIFYKYKLPSFVDVVKALIKNGRIDAKKQNALDGRQYFSMHYKLCEIVEKKLNYS
jgi:folate-dependent phosphoribosylglycinamide formyltransferase PurN